MPKLLLRADAASVNVQVLGTVNVCDVLEVPRVAISGERPPIAIAHHLSLAGRKAVSGMSGRMPPISIGLRDVSRTTPGFSLPFIVKG